jgi:O-antigen ligase
MILLAPIPYGSVAPWTQGALVGLAVLLVGLWLLRALHRGEIVLVRTWIWPALALLFALVVLQMVSLPIGLVAALSPEAAIAHQSAAPPGEMIREATLSLFPHGTETAFFRLLVMAVVFFVMVHVLERKSDLTLVAAFVVGSAAIQLICGGFRLATDPSQVFWNRPAFASRALAGTYLNAAQLAGLLGMSLALVGGLWMATGAVPRKAGPARPEGRVSRRRVGRRGLLAFGLVLALAFCLTRSHSGLLSVLVSVFLFVLCMGLAARLRKRTLVLFGGVALVLCIGQLIALGLVITWIEQSEPSLAVNWADRVDLYRSAAAMAGAFLWTGSGLGTFEAVFPRFQSGRFGDRVAEHLHNDALQLMSEIGLPGLLLVLTVLVLFTVTTLRAGIRRTDPFCRWLAVGGLVAGATLTAQSLLDGTCLTVAANGVVFAAVMGLAHAAARLTGSDPEEERPRIRTARLRLGPWPVRAALAGPAVLLLVAAASRPVRQAVADVAFNRHLALIGEPTDRHHFLPVPPGRDEVRAEALLARASALDAGNPRHAWWRARAVGRRLDRLARARAREYAEAHLGALGAGVRSLDRLAAALLPGVEQTVRKNRQAEVEAAAADLSHAVRAAPTRAAYRLERSEWLLALARARSRDDADDPARALAVREANRAMSLAPNKPGVLYRASTLLMSAAATASSPEARTDRLAAAAGGFRRALLAEPSFAGAVYDLLLEAGGTPRALIEATPPTPGAYARLAERLFEEEAWCEMLAALDGMDRLRERPARPKASLPAGRSDRVGRMAIDAARRRAVAYGRLGQWKRRAAAVRKLQALMAAELDLVVEEANRKVDDGRPLEAGILYRSVVARDRDHARALSGLARLLARPDADPEREADPPLLGVLYRLVLLARAADPRVFDAVADLAKDLEAGAAGEDLTTRFIRGVAEYRAGRPRVARSILHALATTRIASGRVPVNWHLVHYYLGRAAEADHDPAAARASYRSVLARVPTHRAARERLRALGEDAGRRLALEAASDLVRTEVNFAGRVRLVGFRLVAGAGGEDGSGVTVDTLWECGPASLNGLSMRIELLGAEGQIVDSAAASLAPEGEPHARGGAGARFQCTVRLRAIAGRELRLSVVKDQPAVGEKAVLETDALESWLLLKGQEIE